MSISSISMMKNLAHILSRFICVCAVVASLCACHSFSADSRRLQRVLNEREVLAEKQAEQLAQTLSHQTSFDSIRAIAAEDPNLLFYIFDARQMLYWSDNWLSADEVFLTVYDRWQYAHFSNAHVVMRWTKAEPFNILSVIPIRYDYPLETRHMHNTFVPPFSVADKRDVTRLRNDEYAPIFSPDGDYLFSLIPEGEPLDNTEGYAVADQSFSFRALLPSELPTLQPWYKSLKLHVRLYFILCIALFALLFVVGIIVWVRYRGLRNMPLSTRMMFVILVCVLAVFIYIFVMSVRYVRTNYEQRQREELVTRSEYIQSYLREVYYWDTGLSASQASRLSVDLRDLGYDLNQDIHVYSLSGELIASSSPGLFNNGILSRRMSPEAIFSDNRATVCYERLASHPYLVSYVPFHNGSFVPIGYIAMPAFLSEQVRNVEIDRLLARLLPPYIIVLILAILFSYWAAKSTTRPISMLIEKMRHFEIGAKENHIVYPYHDELGELVERYNRMVDKVEQSAEQLAEDERESAWQTMAHQVAHEINNPLTPMKLSVQRLQRLHGTAQFDEVFEKTSRMLISEIDNLAYIAQSFSNFAKQQEVIPVQVDVAEKLSDVITLQRSNDEQIPIRYVGPDSGVMAYADQEKLGQVFINIIRNAIQELSQNKQPRESSGFAPDIIVMLNATYSDDEVQISFSDNGSGIPEEIRQSIFLPKFTTKSNGNGLGLAISKRIIEGAGGRITFDTSEKGTTFYIYLRKNRS